LADSPLVPSAERGWEIFGNLLPDTKRNSQEFSKGEEADENKEAGFKAGPLVHQTARPN
jgi:hypothetical protein